VYQEYLLILSKRQRLVATFVDHAPRSALRIKSLHACCDLVEPFSEFHLLICQETQSFWVSRTALKTSFQKSVHKFIETSSVVGVEPVGIGGFVSQKTKMSDDVGADGALGGLMLRLRLEDVAKLMVIVA
jgi:hypothetical protein